MATDELKALANKVEQDANWSRGALQVHELRLQKLGRLSDLITDAAHDLADTSTDMLISLPESYDYQLRETKSNHLEWLFDNLEKWSLVKHISPIEGQLSRRLYRVTYKEIIGVGNR